MKYALAVVVVASLASCVSTAWFASEYDQQYYLAEDMIRYSSTSFTGFRSVWLTGPERVETIAPATTPEVRGTRLRKGCPARVVKIFRVFGIDASYSEAKLQITDRESASTHVVYVKWPGAKPLLTTKAPNAS